MPKARIRFHRCILPNLPLEPGLEQAVATVYFTVESGGQTLETAADVVQPVGADYRMGGLEVRLPRDAVALAQPDQLGRAVISYLGQLQGQRAEGLTTAGVSPGEDPEASIFQVEATAEVDAA